MDFVDFVDFVDFCVHMFGLGAQVHLRQWGDAIKTLSEEKKQSFYHLEMIKIKLEYKQKPRSRIKFRPFDPFDPSDRDLFDRR